MANFKGFQDWINKKYSKFHQELSAELRMMLRKEIDNTLSCKYETHLNHEVYSSTGGFDILRITDITLNKDNTPIFKGEIIYDDGEFEKVEYDITEITTDELFSIIMTIAE